MIYQHERKEPKHYDGPRPEMPKENESLRSKMSRYLEGRELSYALANNNFWYPSRDVDGYDRIVIPCSNSLGITYYQARAMDSWVSRRYDSPLATREDSIAVLWPDGTRIAKGTVICEGPMDALAACGLNYVGIGLMGNQPPDTVVRHIVRLIKRYFEPVIIVPDLDHIEMGAYMVGCLAGVGIVTKIILPTQKDLCKMPFQERKVLLCGI